MSEVLSASELDMTRELLNAAFLNSAVSFSSIAKQEVFFETVLIEIDEQPDNFEIINTGGEEYVVLETSILGSMSGKSYLIFDEEQASYIKDIGLPDSVTGEQRKMLEEAILLEIDNMLAAAVITEFSNRLNLSMYGGVPSMKLLKKNEVNHLIQEDLKGYKNDENVYLLKTNLTYTLPEKSTIKPQFVWVFSEDFINAVKGLEAAK